MQSLSDCRLPVHYACSLSPGQSVVCNAGSPSLCTDTAARLIVDIWLIAEHDKQRGHKLELEKKHDIGQWKCAVNTETVVTAEKPAITVLCFTELTLENLIQPSGK